MRTHTTDKLIEYMKIHLISLEQDLDKYPERDYVGRIPLNASIDTIRHLLEVANERD